jgi:exopolysaccharide biosynthesis polyprenyl glycosylphosphotransferase
MGSLEVQEFLATHRHIESGRVEQSRRKAFEIVSGVGERFADGLSAALATWMAFWAYQAVHIGRHVHYGALAIVIQGLLMAGVAVFLLEYDGAYQRGNSLLRIRETERILRVSARAFGLVFPLTIFLSHLVSRWVLIFAIVLVPVFLIIEKQIYFLLIRELHNRGYGVQNVLIYGAGYTGRRVYSALVRSPKLGMNPIAIVDDDESKEGDEIHEYAYTREHSTSVIVDSLDRELIRRHGAQLVLVAIPSLSRQRLDEIAKEAAAAQAGVAFVPLLAFGAKTLFDYVDIDGVLIASFGRNASSSMYEVAKRLFDAVAALLLVVLTAPLWLLVAALIRLDSKGPILFRQERVGRNGKLFEMLKFRSMHVDAAAYDFHPSSSDDPRITGIGRWLRRSSLDELPQLLNVLKGDMSLVGPRPEMPFIVENYNLRQRQRLEVLPGMTGLWQLSADRAFQIHDNILYDFYYIKNRNFFMDLAILLHTFVFAVRGV